MGLDTGHQLRAVLDPQLVGIQLVLAVIGDTIREE
jgi:hypothetical protein